MKKPSKELIITDEAYTEAAAYSLVNKLDKAKYFYYNVFGWHTYWTLKPTWCTPTGKLKGFPRRKLFKPIK